MNSEIIFRAGLTVAIITAGLAFYWLSQKRLLTKADSHIHALLGEKPKAPVIVYFTTPDCAPCKTVQKPALKKVAQDLGSRVQVIEINAVEKPDLAKQWGVMSVPTTFLLDSRGQARYVNNGVTRAEKLMEQIHTLY